MAGLLSAIGMGKVSEEGSHEFVQRVLFQHGLLLIPVIMIKIVRLKPCLTELEIAPVFSYS